MGFQRMSGGKVLLVCLVSAILTFVATGIALLLTGSLTESAIVVVAAAVVLLVPLAKFVSETWKWLSWKEAKSRRSVEEPKQSDRPQGIQPLRQDPDPVERTPRVPQPAFVDQPSRHVSATVTGPTDAR